MYNVACCSPHTTCLYSYKKKTPTRANTVNNEATLQSTKECVSRARSCLKSMRVFRSSRTYLAEAAAATATEHTNKDVTQPKNRMTAIISFGEHEHNTTPHSLGAMPCRALSLSLSLASNIIYKATYLIWNILL